MKYVGLADCHGVESFIPEAEANMFVLKMRALANRHRHAVVYRIDASEDLVKTINKRLEKGDYEGALVVLKVTPNVEIMKEPGMAKSWKLIPNSDLDPFVD